MKLGAQNAKEPGVVLGGVACECIHEQTHTKGCVVEVVVRDGCGCMAPYRCRALHLCALEGARPPKQIEPQGVGEAHVAVAG